LQIQYDLTHWDPDLETRDQYLFLVVDHFTKFAWARAIPNKSAVSVHDSLKQLLTELPTPRIALSDNGTEFRNELVSQLLRTNNVMERHGRPYHKTTNGGAERVNLTITRMVRNRELCHCWRASVQTSVLTRPARMTKAEETRVRAKPWLLGATPACGSGGLQHQQTPHH
jgi:transposase InsO family protein